MAVTKKSEIEVKNVLGYGDGSHKLNIAATEALGDNAVLEQSGHEFGKGADNIAVELKAAKADATALAQTGLKNAYIELGEGNNSLTIAMSGVAGGGAAPPANSKGLDGSGGGAGSGALLLASKGSDKLTLTGMATALDTATVNLGAGANSVNISATTAMTASALVTEGGNDTVSMSGAVTNSAITLGAGTNTMTLSGDVSGSTITGGAGVDKITLTGDLASSLIDAGDGKNVVAIRGDITGTGSSFVAVKTGKDADSVTVSGAISNAGIESGAGNDTVYLSAPLGAGAVIDGGEGLDSLNVSARSTVTLDKILGEGTIQNIEIIDLTDKAAGALYIRAADLAGAGIVTSPFTATSAALAKNTASWTNPYGGGAAGLKSALESAPNLLRVHGDAADTVRFETGWEKIGSASGYNVWWDAGSDQYLLVKSNLKTAVGVSDLAVRLALSGSTETVVSKLVIQENASFSTSTFKLYTDAEKTTEITPSAGVYTLSWGSLTLEGDNTLTLKVTAGQTPPSSLTYTIEDTGGNEYTRGIAISTVTPTAAITLADSPNGGFLAVEDAVDSAYKITGSVGDDTISLAGGVLKGGEIKLGGGADALSIGGNVGSNGAVTVTGSGDNEISVNGNVAGSTVTLNGGDDTVSIGGTVSSTKIVLGAGTNGLDISGAATSLTVTGSGTNDITLGGDAASSTITLNGGDDTVTVTGDVLGGGKIDLGLGINSLTVGYALGDGVKATTVTGKGDNAVAVGSANNAVITLNGGNDAVTVGGDAAKTKITLGAGANGLTVDGILGAGNAKTAAVNSTVTGSGDNDITLGGMANAVMTLNGGNDAVTVKAGGLAEGRALVSWSTVKLGAGKNTLTVSSEAADDGTFSGLAAVGAVITGGNDASTVSLTGKNGVASTTITTGKGNDVIGVYSMGTDFVTGQEEKNPMVTTTATRGAQYALGAGSVIRAGDGDNTVVVSVRAGTAMENGSKIVTGSGNDTISILGDQVKASGSSLTGHSTGISGASVDAGNGNNTIHIQAKYGMIGETAGNGKITQASLKTGNGNDDVYINACDPVNANTSGNGGRANSMGMADAVYTDAGGDNTFRINATGGAAIGMYNSAVTLGAGKDTVEIYARYYSVPWGSAPSYALYGTSTLNVGAGDDIVRITGAVEGKDSRNLSRIDLGAGNNELQMASNIKYATISGGAGHDSILIEKDPNYSTSKPFGNQARSEISYTTIALGNGNNTLEATAVMRDVTITAGTGLDSINIAGELAFSSVKDSGGNAGITVAAAHEDAIALYYSGITTGAGNDTVRISSTFDDDAMAIFGKSSVVTGAGDDVVEIVGDVLAQKAESGVKIDLGAGADSLLIDGDVGFSRYYDPRNSLWINSPATSGVVSIIGGSQADAVTVTGTITGASIDAGAGNDRVSIGGKLGKMTELKGGKGLDTLNVSGLGLKVDEALYTLRGSKGQIVGDAKVSGFEVLDISRSDGIGTRLSITGADLAAMLKGETAVKFTYNQKTYNAALIIEGTAADSYMLGVGWEKTGSTLREGRTYDILVWGSGSQAKYVLINAALSYSPATRIAEENRTALAAGAACEFYDITLSGALDIALGSFKSSNMALGDQADVISIVAGGDAGADGKTEFSSIGTGGGNDTLTLETVKASEIDLGAGNNTLSVTGAAENTTISAGDGNNVVTIAALTGDSTLSLGGGNNGITVNHAENSAVTAGASDDTVLLGTSENVTLNLGGGSDSVTIAGASESLSVQNTGGNTVLTIAGGASQKGISVNLGPGRDTLTVGAADAAALVDNAYFNVGRPVFDKDGKATDGSGNDIELHLQKIAAAAYTGVTVAIAGNVSSGIIRMYNPSLEAGQKAFMNMQLGSTRQEENSYFKDTDISFSAGTNTLSVVGVTELKDMTLSFESGSTNTIMMGMEYVSNSYVADPDSALYFDNLTLSFDPGVTGANNLYMQGVDDFDHSLKIVNGIAGQINLGNGNDSLEYLTGAARPTIRMGAGDDEVSVKQGAGGALYAPYVYMDAGDDTLDYSASGLSALSSQTYGGAGTDTLKGLGGFGSAVEGMAGKKEYNLNSGLGSEFELFDLSEGRAEGESFILRFSGAYAVQSYSAESFAYTVAIAGGGTAQFNDAAPRVTGRAGDTFVMDADWTLLGTTTVAGVGYHVLQVTSAAGATSRVLLDTSAFSPFAGEAASAITAGEGVYGKNVTPAALPAAIGNVRYSSIRVTGGSTTSTINLMDFSELRLHGDGNSLTVTQTMTASTIALGNGNNSLNVGGDISVSFITGGEDDDTLTFGGNANVVLDMGNGDNTLYANGSYTGGKITAGAGNDVIEAQGRLSGAIDLGAGNNSVSVTGAGNLLNADLDGVQTVAAAGAFQGDIRLEEGDGAANIVIQGNTGWDRTGSTPFGEYFKIALTDADDVVALGTQNGGNLVAHTEIDLGGGTNVLTIHAENWGTNYFTLKGNVSAGSLISFDNSGSGGSTTGYNMMELEGVTLHDGFAVDFKQRVGRLVIGDDVNVADAAGGGDGQATFTGSEQVGDILDLSLHGGEFTIAGLLGKLDVKGFEKIALAGFKTEVDPALAGKLRASYADILGLEADALASDLTYKNLDGADALMDAGDRAVYITGTFSRDMVLPDAADWTAAGTYTESYTNYDVYTATSNSDMFLLVQQLTL